MMSDERIEKQRQAILKAYDAMLKEQVKLRKLKIAVPIDRDAVAAQALRCKQFSMRWHDEQDKLFGND